MVAPAVTEGDELLSITILNIVFPKNEFFYDYFTGRLIKDKTLSLNVKFSDYAPLFVNF